MSVKEGSDEEQKTDAEVKSSKTDIDVLEQQLIEAVVKDLESLDDETIALTRGNADPQVEALAYLVDLLRKPDTDHHSEHSHTTIRLLPSQ